MESVRATFRTPLAMCDVDVNELPHGAIDALRGLVFQYLLPNIGKPLLPPARNWLQRTREFHYAPACVVVAGSINEEMAAVAAAIRICMDDLHSV